jgi:ABC-type dipeptide/oligopeptide/nickel transport system ATPase component
MPGQPPDLSLLGPECPFLPRCSKVTLRCRSDAAPVLAPYEGDEEHRLACYNPIAVALRE